MNRKATIKKKVMKCKDSNVWSGWEMLSGSDSGSDIPRRIRMPRHIHHSPSLILSSVAHIFNPNNFQPCENGLPSFPP